jgi:hypothetical protein
VREEDAYLYPDPHHDLAPAPALDHGVPHDGSNHNLYLIHDQKSVVEIDDHLYPLFYAVTSKLIENHLTFLLVLG